MKIYLAGPMRGFSLHNFPAFEAAAAALRSLGHEVFSPAEHDLVAGFNPELTMEEQGFNLKEALLTDLAWVAEAETVVVLPCWECSRGTMAEVHTAWALDIPVYELEDFLAGNMEEVAF